MLNDASANTVALSFEDGPDPVWTRRILASLDASGTRATFFVASPRAVVWPEIIEEIAEAGHEIGLHCGRHLAHPGASEESVRKDAEVALSVLSSQNVDVRLWLPPCGQVAPFSGELARRLGLQLISWTIDPIGDASGSVDTVIDRVTSEIHPGSIVRAFDGFDDGVRAALACELSLAMIRPLTDHLEARGYEAIPVGEIATRVLDLADDSSVAEPPIPV